MSTQERNDQPIDVLVPRDPPELTPIVARLLLGILTKHAEARTQGETLDGR